MRSGEWSTLYCNLNDGRRSPNMLWAIAGQRIRLAPSSRTITERNQWSQLGCKFTCKSEQSDLHSLVLGICALCSSIKRIGLIPGRENCYDPSWHSLLSTLKASPAYGKSTWLKLSWLKLLWKAIPICCIYLNITILKSENVC